jgi:hypothetical protein
MANIAKWNIRLRHEWLQSPLKKKRLKRSEKARCGLLAAEQRKAERDARKQASKAAKAASNG